MIKQRVSEALEKAKRQSAEEKQRLIVEANAKLRDTVTAARSEIEGRMAQAQALAVQEALKEANAQSSSKEVSSCFCGMFPFRVSFPSCGGKCTKDLFSLGWPSLIPRLSPLSLFHLQYFYAYLCVSRRRDWAALVTWTLMMLSMSMVSIYTEP